MWTATTHLTVARSFSGRPAGWRTKFNGPTLVEADAIIAPPARRVRAPRPHRGPFPETPTVLNSSEVAADLPKQLDEPCRNGQQSSPSASNRSDSTNGTPTNNHHRCSSSSSSAKAASPTQQRKKIAKDGSSNGHSSNGHHSNAKGGGPPPEPKRANGGSSAPPPPKPTTTVGQPNRPWYGSNPQLEAQIPTLLQQCTQQQNGTATENARRAAAEARMLLETCAESEQPITQFYLGVAVGALDGEAAACDYYERALKQLPLLHNARNNLIRGLMRRGSPQDLKSAIEHANLSAGLQPEVAEMQYQLGVVLMQQHKWDEAAAAYERTLQLDARHHGAYINGVHSIQQIADGNDKGARKRLEKLARMGVKQGLWQTWWQRPPHLLPGLRSQPWWDRRAFPWCALLERNFGAIKEEVLALKGNQTFTPVGGRAAHDSTLVAAGEWREFPLFGNGQQYEANCARCPVTTRTMQHVSAAIDLAMAGGGETLFSTLKVCVLACARQSSHSEDSKHTHSLFLLSPCVLCRPNDSPGRTFALTAARQTRG